MPSEREELQLTVSLVDNASAGIVALKNNIQQLTSGQTAASFETFRRQHRAMGDQIKELTAAAIGGEKAMLGYISRFGALGLAASAGVASMKSYAQSMADINRMSQTLGVSREQIKSVVDQWTAVGASTQEAEDQLRSFTQAVVDLNRRGSPQFQELLHHAGGFEDQMVALVRQVGAASTAQDKLNLVTQAGEAVRKNRIEQDKAMGASIAQQAADGAKAQEEFLRLWGLSADLVARLQKQFDNLTTAQAAHNKQVLDDGEELVRAWNQIGAAAKNAKEEMLLAFGPNLSELLRNTAKEIETIVGALNKFEEWRKSPHGKGLGALPRAIVPGPGGILPGTAPDLGKQLGIDRIPSVPSIGTPTGGVSPLLGGGWDKVPLSTNIEDRRNSGRLMDDNTKELKKLNDNLFALLHPAEGGGGGGGLGGGAVGALGSGIGGGSAPYGSSVGPGTGEGAGATSPFSMLESGGGLGALGGIGAGGDGRSRGGVPHAALELGTPRGGAAPYGSHVGPGSGAAGDGAGRLAAPIRMPSGTVGEPSLGPFTSGGGTRGGLNRSRFAAELGAKPWLRDKIMRIASNEQGTNPQGTQAILESMMNRAEVRGTSLEQQARWHESEHGYYQQGNMGRGALEHPRSRAVLESSLSNALGGSNISNFATDNASGGLAARQRATGKFKFASAYHGETFFTPGTAEPGLERRYEAWRGTMAEADRRAIDAHTVRTQKIEATGKLTANINAPKGTDVTLEGGGVFRKIEVNRQVQMVKARPGPAAGESHGALR
jgi:hypothetical protein